MARDRASRAAIAFRVALALAGLALLVAIVRHVGVDAMLATLRPALKWLPVLCGLELARMACETLSSWLAFGSLATRIPRATLLRAHVIGQSLSSLAPAPRVVNESQASRAAPLPRRPLSMCPQQRTFLTAPLGP